MLAYVIVKRSSLLSLQLAVNDRIDWGLTAIGGPSQFKDKDLPMPVFMQAMVLLKSTEEELEKDPDLFSAVIDDLCDEFNALECCSTRAELFPENSVEEIEWEHGMRKTLKIKSLDNLTLPDLHTMIAIAES